jgi:hypothetical protein
MWHCDLPKTPDDLHGKQTEWPWQLIRMADEAKDAGDVEMATLLIEKVYAAFDKISYDACS